MSKLTLPLKWHGGKFYLAPKINSLMPPHIHYVESHFGGGSVLLARSGQGRSELVNDINRNLTNFWRVLQVPATFQAFMRTIEAVPLSREEWRAAGERLEYGEPVDRAVAFFIVCRQSLAGRMKSFTPPTRSRTRRGMNGNVSEWLGAIEGLPAVHERLKRVFIETMPADVLLMREDKPGTLIYCDPPYLHSERATTDDYEHEMTSKDHEAFLRIASKVGCKVMISGYRSDMYDYYLEQWTRHEFELPNNAAGGASKRRMTECLWCNWRA